MSYSGLEICSGPNTVEVLIDALEQLKHQQASVIVSDTRADGTDAGELAVTHWSDDDSDDMYYEIEIRDSE